MIPTAHPVSDLLDAYATGTISDGMGLLVASHLTFCAACRSEVAAREAISGALLQDGDEAAPSPGCLDRILARIDALPAPLPVPIAFSILPAPLRARVGVDLGDIRWRFVMPGLSEHRLPGFAGEDVRLLRGKPGLRILNHTHEGDEATLVLQGRLRDGGREFARGDVSLAGHTNTHRPEIVGTETCVCLIVLGGRMRFTGLVGRVVNLFG